MELNEYSNRFKLVKRSNKQILADQIYEFFGKRLPYSQIMILINRKGIIFMGQEFNDIQKTECKDKLSLFLWKIKQVKIHDQKTD